MAEECITYGIPTFKVDGRSVAGFGAYLNHCTYFPMSGSIDKPLPVTLVKKLIKTRLQESLKTRAR